MADVARKKRWMPAVLGISLALNLAVIAAVSGAAWRHKGVEKNGPRASKGGAIYMQALPRAMQKNLRQSVHEIGSGARNTPAAMVAVLRQEPFDSAAAMRILEAERDGGLSRLEAMGTAWLSTVSEMTVQERSAYTDRLEDLAERRKQRWKERKRD